jgi:5'-nucleotidase
MIRQTLLSSMTLSAATLGAGLLFSAAPAHALNILISNDDGFESANIRALYQTLKAAGHNVVISAPVQNQSGQGAAVAFLTPIGPLATPSRYGTIPAGAPGVGTDPKDPNIHYVAGSPVASILYGLDVVAPQAFGKQPDLILSGPNEGNNLGNIIISSGTVSNALAGLTRGVPSIAVSAGESASRSYTTLGGADDPSFRDAALVAQMVKTLETAHGTASDGLLPAGWALNVNIPAFSATCTPTKFSLTRVGYSSSTLPVFFSNLSQNSFAQQAGLGSVSLPGIGLAAPTDTLPAGVVLPTDNDPKSESNAIQNCVVTVSPIITDADVGAELVKTDPGRSLLRGIRALTQ